MAQNLQKVKEKIPWLGVSQMGDFVGTKVKEFMVRKNQGNFIKMPSIIPITLKKPANIQGLFNELCKLS